MTQPAVGAEVSIGACLGCNAVILVTPSNPNCRLCGQAPAHTLLFDDDERLAAAVEPAPPELEPAPEPHPDDEEASWAEVLTYGIHTYLDDGPITDADLRVGFGNLGVGPEDAATALGRVEAVRDLIRQYRPDPDSSAVAPPAPAPSEEPAPEATLTPEAGPSSPSEPPSTPDTSVT